MINFSDLEEFAEFMKRLSKQIGFRVSSRGWAYILEQKRFINKGQFDTATRAINNCRKKGLLPINFTAEEAARNFEGVEEPEEDDIIHYFGSWLEYSLKAGEYYTPDWWQDEQYYIQMVVEKVDLVTLFKPVCKEYKIPIANSRGWSSMLQRATYAQRFAEAEAAGLKCVLLYCGDHDPDGLRISDFLRSNLADLKNITWSDGSKGYDPENLIIDRFGLNFDFIEKNGFTWIDNLETGSGKNLADPRHKHYNMPYMQQYLRTVGVRKCEANAIVVLPEVAQNLVRAAIEKYLGEDAADRFKKKRRAVINELNDFLEETESNELIEQIFDNIKDR